ncbi:MAG: SLBB domain-containing protein, partial [Candidatus Saccharimonadaceae bacterium]|nr:SLBB domain-containing protein [Candidatus Saccharimonadaceae bacterium]
MTTKALADELTKKIAQDVEAPYVRVELINFKVKVMGEVMKPTSVLVTGERMSILDALAEAGDMTIYAQRDNVLLIREENGVKNYYRID